MGVFLYWILCLAAQAPTTQDLFQQGRYAEAAALLERGDSSRGSRYLLGLSYQQMGVLVNWCGCQKITP